MTNDIVDYDKKFLNFSMRQSLLSKEDEVEFIKNWQLHRNEKSINKIVSSHTREQIDSNKITIGWYGECVEKNTDATANPNGEDVNKGWYQAMRDHNSERLISEVVDGSNLRENEDDS